MQRMSNEEMAYELFFDPTFCLPERPMLASLRQRSGISTSTATTAGQTVALFHPHMSMSLEFGDLCIEELSTPGSTHKRTLEMLEQLFRCTRECFGVESTSLAIFDADFIKRRIDAGGARVLLPIFKVVSALVAIVRSKQQPQREAEMETTWGAVKARCEAKLRIGDDSRLPADERLTVIRGAVGEAVEQRARMLAALESPLQRDCALFTGGNVAPQARGKIELLDDMGATSGGAYKVAKTSDFKSDVVPEKKQLDENSERIFARYELILLFLLLSLWGECAL